VRGWKAPCEGWRSARRRANKGTGKIRQRAIGGGVLGAGTGGAIGGLAGGGRGAAAGALIGGAVGAVGGAATTPQPPPAGYYGPPPGYYDQGPHVVHLP